MKTLYPLVLLFAGASFALGASKPFAIWPHGAPGDTAQLEERDTTTPTDKLIAGRRIIKLGGVSNPTIAVYPAPKGNNTGAAVLVFPGGGYNILAMDLEGTEVCEWLNSIGISGVLLNLKTAVRQWRQPVGQCFR